ncbi:Low temperature viability protein [Neohortaea acidophila]|uniref:Low temperature viability protein n=1 Tax=Neohortaea acidophila TaxID=245834 RepID=A0A6A6PXX7_9PEZI|nr:Low temperature viability protein [Neohortaea acidophila]KAF2484594.1 Low temperature viability protein [Neohortaea acidophila]
MPRRRFIDKKNATTFALVHRAQNDPLIHDEDAPSMVFAEKTATQRPRRPTEDDYMYSDAASVISGGSSAVYRSAKTQQRGDLEEEFGVGVRANEGEAAQHGVFFDDTKYDYMQHMRDLGTGDGPVMWVEAAKPKQQQGKGKQKLEDALQSMEIASVDGSTRNTTSTSASMRSILPDEMFGSEFVKKQTYQDQQDVPDAIAGFQPDMDERVREMLEALEDEAYVDDGEDDFFGELIDDGLEYDREEWEEIGVQLWDQGAEDDAASDSEDTVRASSPPPTLDLPEGETAKPPEDTQAVPPADPTGGAWFDEFKKFKSAAKSSDAPAVRAVPSTLESSALSSLAAGRKKKRKGAKTSTTNYSMTSSALARTDHQTLLDDRFDKLESAYALDEFPDDEEDDGRFDDALSSASAPQLQRSDFDSIMDDFLGGHAKTGKQGKRIRRGGPQSGMEQLEEVRKGLGPARLQSRTAAS